MPIEDSIRAIADRIPCLMPHIQTEEATKNALILPFIAALGYDPFNPAEVMPEFVADVGVRQGERVDYALMRSGEPIILFECKIANADLDGQRGAESFTQLYRYFTTTPARVAVLTNGVVYRFYTDLDKPNTMDERPFLEVDLADLDDATLSELHRFAKDSFDPDSTVEVARELRYTNEIQCVLVAEFANPSAELVRMIARRVYGSGAPTATVRGFESLAKSAFARFIEDRVNARLKSALDRSDQPPAADPQVAPATRGPTVAPELPRDLFLKHWSGMEAQARQDENGVVVLAGSQVWKEERQTLSAQVLEARRTALEQGLLVDDGKTYRLTDDRTFRYISTAASFILGWRVRGDQVWRSSDGTRLKDIP